MDYSFSCEITSYVVLLASTVAADMGSRLGKTTQATLDLYLCDYVCDGGLGLPCGDQVCSSAASTAVHTHGLLVCWVAVMVCIISMRGRTKQDTRISKKEKNRKVQSMVVPFRRHMQFRKDKEKVCSCGM